MTLTFSNQIVPSADPLSAEETWDGWQIEGHEKRVAELLIRLVRRKLAAGMKTPKTASGKKGTPDRVASGLVILLQDEYRERYQKQRKGLPPNVADFARAQFFDEYRANLEALGGNAFLKGVKSQYPAINLAIYTRTNGATAQRLIDDYFFLGAATIRLGIKTVSGDPTKFLDAKAEKFEEDYHVKSLVETVRKTGAPLSRREIPEKSLQTIGETAREVFSDMRPSGVSVEDVIGAAIEFEKICADENVDGNVRHALATKPMRRHVVRQLAWEFNRNKALLKPLGKPNARIARMTALKGVVSPVSECRL